MASGKASVHLRGRFAPGTKVRLIERYGDNYLGGGTEAGTGKVDAEGEVSFDGLDAGRRFWIVGEIDDTERAVAMTAKEQPQRSRMSAKEQRERLAQTRPPDRRRESVTGARTSANTRVTTGTGQPFAHEQTGKPTPKEERENEPQPHLRLEDVSKSTPLRSHTITGSAHPVEPGEPQPKPSQDDVRKGTAQRSDTPLGEATVKTAVDEEQPKRSQETQRGKQRSDTETGEAEPKPRASAVKQAKVRDSAESKAKGATAAVAGTTKKAGKGKR